MRITKVNIPKSEYDNGIEDIQMSRLENLVLIAGKNGSGKTRILRKIEYALSEKISPHQILSINENIKLLQSNILYDERQIEISERELIEKSSSNIAMAESEDFINFKKQTEDLINSRKEKVAASKLTIASQQKNLNHNIIETSASAPNYKLIHFAPKILELRDPAQLSRNDLTNIANNTSSIGIESLPIGALAKIQKVQDKWFEATHQSSNSEDSQKTQQITNYERLSDLIGLFFNSPLGRDSEGQTTLFGFPLGQTNLSDGQKIILQLCIAIYSQQESLKDLILSMDEPENHLHPSVVIEIIDKILSCLTNGQLWITTHSITILAHYNPNHIWYVENNKISYAGNIPEKVLASLIGDEEEIAKLHDFTGLPSQYALTRHAVECLFEPHSVNTGSDDPQTEQIRSELLNQSSNAKIKILDYGAGKGRLMAHLIEKDIKLVKTTIDYIAYDKFDEDKDDCLRVLKSAYNDSDLRYFNDSTSLFTNHDKESFDIVIMCNVLHEIDPIEWLRLFDSDGFIPSLLKSTGKLLLVEDMNMPIGEKAYQKGFIVLDTPDLKELFSIKSDDLKKGYTVNDFRNDGRLKAHMIPRECLLRITKETRVASLKSLNKRAMEKIIQIRKQEKNYKTGRLHGFWIQQFANTSLALSELTSNKH